MKTFTVDSKYGEMNKDIEWIEGKTRRKIRPVIEEFVKDCIENSFS